MSTLKHEPARILRPPSEERYAEELAALAATDEGDKPPGWRMSPRKVCSFICGTDGAISHNWKGAPTRTVVTRKFYGDDALVERAVIGLASNRALLLVGEPGTAKSLLSELLAAAISGTSVNVVQGTAATTEDQIRVQIPFLQHSGSLLAFSCMRFAKASHSPLSRTQRR